MTLIGEVAVCVACPAIVVLGARRACLCRIRFIAALMTGGQIRRALVAEV